MKTVILAEKPDQTAKLAAPFSFMGFSRIPIKLTAEIVRSVATLAPTPVNIRKISITKKPIKI
ncbi:hypothetical protein ACIQZI_20305 [Peribacillus sp. NPDC096379]|uniref:hypothetical protein n=1 Tax=Peribacillus sp. NPDC096379 TaxID=3364393 RepID=UPI0037FF8C6B